MFCSQFIKTEGKNQLQRYFIRRHYSFFAFFFFFTNGYNGFIYSLVLFQGGFLIFEFSCKEGLYLCLGLWEMLNSVLGRPKSLFGFSYDGTENQMNFLAYPIYLLLSPLMAQGFSSKTVPSLINVPRFESITEVLFESVLFYTHINIVSRVV